MNPNGYTWGLRPRGAESVALCSPEGAVLGIGGRPVFLFLVFARATEMQPWLGKQVNPGVCVRLTHANVEDVIRWE